MMATVITPCSVRQGARPFTAGSRPSARPGYVRSNRAAVSANSQVAELTRWGTVYESLKAQNLEVITPAEAQARSANGSAVLVDVRLGEQYEAGHADGAVSVPMYQTISLQGADLTKMLKFVLYKSNGVNPVDVNDKFDDQLKAAAGGKPVVLMCEAGGTMKPSVNFPLGKSSRSLQASFRALKAGLKVAHMERGLYGWFQSDLPMVGVYTPDIGRTPSAAADPTLQNASAAIGYEIRPEDKKQEEGKKKFFGLF